MQAGKCRRVRNRETLEAGFGKLLETKMGGG